MNETIENEEFVDPIPGRPMHHFAVTKRGRCCEEPREDHPYAFELYTNRVKYYADAE